MKEAEYNQVVEECADALYRFSYRLTKEHDYASDLVQDSFLKLWEFKGAVVKPKSFLFSILYHLFLDGKKKENVRLRYEKELSYIYSANSTILDRQIEKMERKDVLDLALECLSDIQKTVVMLRDYEGYSYEEIGSITGLTQQQVKVYIFRARVNLKKKISEI